MLLRLSGDEPSVSLRIKCQLDDSSNKNLNQTLIHIISSRLGKDSSTIQP